MKEVIIINDDAMGRGSKELGKKLIGTFLTKLWASPIKPDAIIFYNGAVKLLTIGGGSHQALHFLEKAGVDLIACGTCVSYFELEEQINLGRISGMEEILMLIQKAEKVVTI
ncbi:MAG: sulfurtransferase-like selenium metabolism protein YedF [Tissierellia bacterium]|nr:sulfurtransferase-like selenium metabolism protein YedF [Tissierellia bacterium]